MRIIVLMLFVLAFGKVGTQSYIRQESAKATIIKAYREHALVACKPYLARVNSAGPSGELLPDSGRQGTRPILASSVSVDVIIGNPDLDVRLWQTSHSYWSQRYSDPFIIVRSDASPSPAICQYDINRGTVQARTAVAGARGNG